MRIKNAMHVASWRLCTGCGACVYACPENRISIVDIVSDGIRPRLESEECGDCEECLKVCPGIGISCRNHEDRSVVINELIGGWGDVLEVWEGYASDYEVRYNGSSGGLATALALYCLEKDDMKGVLHVGADKDKPFRNRTFLSISRSEVLSRTGSRYSPASPCEALDRVEASSGQCVFIGKPCDVAGLRKAQIVRPVLKDKVGLAIGIFCAGTPSTMATLDLLHHLRVEPNTVEEIRYRGKGWPGNASVSVKNGTKLSHDMSYKESWGFLQKYRPYRCYLCPDGTSEFADISCGDPWYRERKEDEPGRSLVLIRNENGRRILRNAVEAGYVSVEKVESEVLRKSQQNLFLKRSSIWGRLFAMKVFAVPTPQFCGFSLFHNWMRLPIREKVRSIFGTVRRIIQRKYFMPLR